MTKQNIKTLVSKFLVDDLSAISADDLEDDTDLISEGILDSMSAMRLVNHIETKLQIKIPPRDLLPRNFMSVEAITHYLESRGD